jgi:WD40 repeat protein
MELGEKASKVSALAFSPDGKMLASAGSLYSDWDQNIYLWDVATGKEMYRFSGQRGSTNCLAFSPDGKLLASGANDTTILVWEVPTKQEKIQPVHSNPPSKK